MKKLASLFLLSIALVAMVLLATRSLRPGPTTERSASAAELSGSHEVELPEPDAPDPLEPDTKDARAVSTPGGSTPVRGARDRVAAAAPSEEDGHQLAGRVIDETGAGVETFWLHAEFKRRGVGNDWESVELGPFHGGDFRVEGQPAGRWRIVPVADRHKEAKQTRLRLPQKSGPLVLSLQRLARVEGVVLDPNGDPRVGVEVSFKNDGAFSAPVTDEAGAFALDVYPGVFESVAKDEIYAASETVRGVAKFDEPVSIELWLRAGGRIEGEVQDREGQPLAGYYVALRTLHWDQDKRSSASSNLGQFVFPHVAAGTYWLEANESELDGPGGPDALRASVEVVEGETARVQLGGINPDAVMLSGTVYRAGEALPNESVWGAMQGGGAFASGSRTKANERGEYELEFPGSGRALVMVSLGPTQIIPLTLELTEEPEQEFDIHVPVGRITGRVMGIESGEFRKTSVSCRPEGRSPTEVIYLSRNVRCDEKGDFAFEGLPQGSYRVALANVFDPGGVVEGIELEADGEVSGLQLKTGETSKAEVLVLDGNGQPVSGAKVYAQDSAGHLYLPGLTGETDVNGIMSFSSFTAGDYRFFAQSGETVSAFSAPLQIGSEEPQRVTVELGFGGRASIQVLDGEKPVYARLWIWDSSGNEFSRTLEMFDPARYMTEGDNPESYALGPLVLGTYRVRAKAYDGRSAEGELKVREGTQAELVLQLRP